MQLAQLFVPRDVVAARKLVVLLTGVAAVITLLFAVLQPRFTGGATALWLSLAGPLVVLCLAVVISVTPEPSAWIWFAYPATATIAVLVSDLASHDASLTGLVFFVFPVLFAGAQLQRVAAYVLCGVAVATAITVAMLVLPLRMAVVDGVYIAAALITVATTLIYSGERVDRLIGQLREQAAIDPLTGLVTRRVLDSAVSTSLHSAASDGGTGLIVVDVDFFKKINDEHGHLAGDLVLQEMAAALRHGSRRTDVVSRMGGDELAVLMPGCSLQDAIHRAEQTLDRVRGLRVDVSAVSMSRVSPEVPLRVTASLGLAHLPTHAADTHDLYRAADVSLYRAKEAGRDRLGLPARTTSPTAI